MLSILLKFESLTHIGDPSTVSIAKHLLSQWPSADCYFPGVFVVKPVPKLPSKLASKPVSKPVPKTVVSKSVSKPVHQPVRFYTTSAASPQLEEYGDVFDSEIALTREKVQDIMVDFFEITLPSGRVGYVLKNYISNAQQLLWLLCFVVKTTEGNQPRRKSLATWAKDYNKALKSGSCIVFDPNLHGHILDQVVKYRFCKGAEVSRTDYGSSLTHEEFKTNLSVLKLPPKFCLHGYCNKRLYCPENEWENVKIKGGYIYGPIFDFIQQFGFVCKYVEVIS